MSRSLPLLFVLLLGVGCVGAWAVDGEYVGPGPDVIRRELEIAVRQEVAARAEHSHDRLAGHRIYQNLLGGLSWSALYVNVSDTGPYYTWSGTSRDVSVADIDVRHIEIEQFVDTYYKNTEYDVTYCLYSADLPYVDRSTGNSKSFEGYNLTNVRGRRERIRFVLSGRPPYSEGRRWLRIEGALAEGPCPAERPKAVTRRLPVLLRRAGERIFPVVRIDGRPVDPGEPVMVRFRAEGVYEVIDDCYGAYGYFVGTRKLWSSGREFQRTCSTQSTQVAIVLRNDPVLSAGKNGEINVVRERPPIPWGPPPPVDASRVTLGAARPDDQGPVRKVDVSRLADVAGATRPVLVRYKRYPQTTLVWQISLTESLGGYDFILSNRTNTRIAGTFSPQPTSQIAATNVRGQLNTDGMFRDAPRAFESVDDDALGYSLVAALNSFTLGVNARNLVLDNRDLRIAFM